MNYKLKGLEFEWDGVVNGMEWSLITTAARVGVLARVGVP